MKIIFSCSPNSFHFFITEQDNDTSLFVVSGIYPCLKYDGHFTMSITDEKSNAIIVILWLIWNRLEMSEQRERKTEI